MAVFNLVANGQKYQVEANSPDEAVAKVKSHETFRPIQSDKNGMMPDPNGENPGHFITRSTYQADPAQAVEAGTGSKMAGMAVKGLNYLTGIPSLGQTAAELGHMDTNPADREAMTGQQRASLGARTLMGGATAPLVAGNGILPMLKGMATAAPGLMAYNESGAAEGVNKYIDQKMPNSPYIAEALKILPQMAIGGASSAGVEGGLSKMSRPKPGAQGATPELAAKLAELERAGYRITPSHANPNDVTLRGLMDDPALADQAKAYMDDLQKSASADYSKTVQPPSEILGDTATGQLGLKMREAFKSAKGNRSQAYKDMLSKFTQKGGERGENVGVGKLVHAGGSWNKSMLNDLKKQGFDVKTIREKVLLGENLTGYDIPAGVKIAPGDVEAAIRFGDLASQKAASAVDLADLVSNFTRDEKLFPKGASSSGFKQRVRQDALNKVEDLIRRGDEARGPASNPNLPDFQKQRANWAQSASLVEELSNKMIPKKDALGKEMTGDLTPPEAVFEKHILSKKSEGIKNFKSFLEDNGQDPKLVEAMTIDYLDQKSKSNGGYSAAKLKSAFERMSPEVRNEALSPQVRQAIEAVLKREALARSPLEVIGIQAKGGSPTAMKIGIKELLQDPQKAKNKGMKIGAAVGTGAGGLIGGLPGSVVGGSVGTVLGNMLGESMHGKALAGKRAAAKSFLNPKEKFYEPQPSNQTPLNRLAQKGTSIRNPIMDLISGRLAAR